MGCFPACFTCSASKRRKSILSIECQAKREESLLFKLITKSKEEVEVKCGTRKRVTFDLGVKECDKSSEKKSGIEEEETTNKVRPPCDTNELCIVLSPALNYRYQNCKKSTDDPVDIGLELSDYSDVDDERIVVEESSDSLFSLSIESRKHQTCEVEKGEKEVNSSLSMSRNVLKAVEPNLDTGKRRQFGDYVLSPIENLTRWIEVEIIKERPVLQCLKRRDKENVLRQILANKSTKLAPQDIKVDTSLSSWLVGSAGESQSNSDDCSVGNSGEFDKENSLRCTEKNEGSSGEYMVGDLPSSLASPLEGTVGSFWVHTGRESDSDSNPFSIGIPKTPKVKT